MDKVLLHRMAKTLSSINYEEEKEYILTPEEERLCIIHAIEAAKKNFAWKLAQRSLHEGDILARLSKVNWEGKINKSLILANANSSKHYQIWQKDQRKKEIEEEVIRRKELLEKWHARHFFRFMKYISFETFDKPLVVNEFTSHLITTICYFMSRDEKFKTELGYSFKKGLLIRGNSGRGKTHTVRCVESNEVRPIFTISTLEINEIVKETGDYAPLISSTGIIYIDDVGTEETTVQFYGTKISWVKNFIEKKYLSMSGFESLIISTNLSFDEIEKKYGFRVRSRMKEMFNIIDVSGVDMRG